MHREAWDEITECVDCGAPVDVARERGYRTVSEWALCWQCATNRGARYDEDEDRWSVPPETSGLPLSDEDHRER